MLYPHCTVEDKEKGSNKIKSVCLPAFMVESESFIPFENNLIFLSLKSLIPLPECSPWCVSPSWATIWKWKRAQVRKNYFFCQFLLIFHITARIFPLFSLDILKNNMILLTFFMNEVNGSIFDVYLDFVSADSTYVGDYLWEIRWPY